MPKFLLSLPVKVISYLLYALTIFSAYGGYFNPESFTLPAIALLIFPYLAMITIVVAVTWLLAKRFVTGGLGVLALLICLPVINMALPLKFHVEPPLNSSTFKMVTFNCLHLQDTQNPDAAESRSVEFLINSGADFICLQELYGLRTKETSNILEQQIDTLLTLYPYYSKDGGIEVEFLSKFPFEKMDIRNKTDFRYMSWEAYRMMIDGHPLTVVNMHLPSYLLSNEERNIITELKTEGGAKKSIEELEGSVMQKMTAAFQLRAKVSEEIAGALKNIEGPLIVCGDFNDVPGSWTYRNFTKAGFKDAYAETGFGHLITYNEHLMYFHIDQILYRGGLKPLSVKKSRLNASDHYPLIAEFAFD